MKVRIGIISIFICLAIFSCKDATPPPVEMTIPPKPPVVMQPGLVVSTDNGAYIIHDGQPGMPRVVLISGDEEYRSEEALPMLAKVLSKHHGFNTAVLFAQNPEKHGLIDGNYGGNIAGLETLEQADLVILFTRFRHLPDDQMQMIDNYLMSGKPIIGIRTATHAFAFSDENPNSKFAHYGNNYKGTDEWQGGFGRMVLGEKWISHHGHHRHQSARGIIAPGAESHPILNGIRDGSIWGPSDVYGVRLPLPGDSHPLVLGQVTNRAAEYDENDSMYGMRDTDSEVAVSNPKRTDVSDINDPMMPIAWTKSYALPGGKSGEAFTSTIGAATDMVNESVRRMFVNATYYLLELGVPENAYVEMVGDYDPTEFKFVDDAYWIEKDMKVSDMK